MYKKKTRFVEKKNQNFFFMNKMRKIPFRRGTTLMR